ncbi:MAG: glycosyltransferase family 1 protein [Ruminococcaceae bacterium]|nr:glycosyltransferase family 1 protein [Oscillospiraceae bacterium]
MKKICIWCEKWGSGGIESFIVNILEALDRTGLEIKLVTATNESDVFDARLQKLGIEKVLLSTNRTSSAITRNLTLPASFKAFLERENFDVIHLNIYHGVAMQYAKLAEKAGVKTRIIHSHNGALRPSKLRFLKEFAHKYASNTMSKFGTHFCACSDVAADWMFPESISARTLMIANGVDLRRFAFDQKQREETRATLCLGNNFTLCCVGRICSQKNQTFLLEVFTRILKNDPSAQLLLAGADDSNGEIVRLAESLSVSNNVHFLGVTDKIPQLLWASDVFVLPSLFEGNPVSGIEAQASGIRCFFSDAITKEAALTDCVSYLSLEDNAEHWANVILASRGCEHTNTSDILRQKGYDIKDSAAMLSQMYRG